MILVAIRLMLRPDCYSAALAIQCTLGHGTGVMLWLILLSGYMFVNLISNKNTCSHWKPWHDWDRTPACPESSSALHWKLTPSRSPQCHSTSFRIWHTNALLEYCHHSHSRGICSHACCQSKNPYGWNPHAWNLDLTCHDMNYMNQQRMSMLHQSPSGSYDHSASLTLWANNIVEDSCMFCIWILCGRQDSKLDCGGGFHNYSGVCRLHMRSIVNCPNLL